MSHFNETLDSLVQEWRATRIGAERAFAARVVCEFLIENGHAEAVEWAIELNRAWVIPWTLAVTQASRKPKAYETSATRMAQRELWDIKKSLDEYRA